MNRRSFLSTILALATAPAIVRASSLMPVRRLDGLSSDVIQLTDQQALLLDSINIEALVRAELCKTIATAIDEMWGNVWASSVTIAGQSVIKCLSENSIRILAKH